MVRVDRPMRPRCHCIWKKGGERGRGTSHTFCVTFPLCFTLSLSFSSACTFPRPRIHTHTHTATHTHTHCSLLCTQRLWADVSLFLSFSLLCTWTLFLPLFLSPFLSILLPHFRRSLPRSIALIATAAFKGVDRPSHSLVFSPLSRCPRPSSQRCFPPPSPRLFPRPALSPRCSPALSAPATLR